jgi:TetR/AcrR family transcriptional regulator, repressor of fatR-cypB operon
MKPNATTKRRSAAGRPPIAGASERILGAALQVFATRGFHGTPVPLVAAGAKVGMGTLYRLFPSKEALVNAVFRDAKQRLAAALLLGLDASQSAEQVFLGLWARVGAFARQEPLTFQFLEMQDHTPYLDTESRALERSVLEPIWQAVLLGQARGELRQGSAEALIATVWGALVGLIKAERLGYLSITPELFAEAGLGAFHSVAELPLVSVPSKKGA